jgi:HTH-type transcriptional regulator, quorum sensing regulator NprR
MSEQNLGEVIKSRRTRLKMNQSELAKGIVSVPYLSKIENNQIKPSEEIVRKLHLKLGIPLSKEKSLVVEDLLKGFYESLLNKDLVKREQYFSDLEKIEKENRYEVQHQIEKFKVLSIKYYIGKLQFDKAAFLIDSLTELVDTLDQDYKYFYYKYQGEFLYQQNNRDKALQYFKKAELYLPHISNKKEIGNLYYAIALATSQLNRIQKSLKYNTDALLIFQSMYENKECVHCHLLMGLSLKKIGNYTESLEHFSMAKKLAEQIQYTRIKYTLEHNIGSVYVEKGDSEQAIVQLINSMQYYDIHNGDSELVTIVMLVKEYIKVNQADKALYWIEKGLNSNESVSERSVKYTYQLQHLQYWLWKDWDRLEKHLKKYLIPVLDEERMYMELSDYTKNAAEVFIRVNKYKQAAMFFKDAHKYLEKSIKVPV